MTSAISFPDQLPPGREWLDGEEPFDPARHLAIEAPEEILTLADLGYTDDDIAPTATTMAASSPFRVLSDEGAAVMLETARRLKAFTTPAGDRIEHVVRGGCYRSRWLRDLCLSSDVTAALSEIYGADIAPHTMGHHLGHINYEPTTVDAAVDKWHHDTIALDYVMMVTDPATTPGGRFEYFLGTKAEAAALSAAGDTPPAERVVAPSFGGPGWVIALHGNMVVHRGAPLSAPGERITMVNAYVALDRSRDDQSRTKNLISVDPDEFLYTEWARHVAWRGEGRLGRLVEQLQLDSSRDEAIAELESAIADITQAIAEMKAGPVAAHHYEQ